jgi:hypothetical protein
LRIELIASKKAYLIETRGHHLLGLIDEQDGPQKGALDMTFPAFPQGLESTVTIGRGKVNPEKRSHFPIEITEVALGPFHHTNDDIAYTLEAVIQHLKILGFSKAGLSTDEGKAPIHDQVFNPKKEGVYSRRGPQGLYRDAGQKGVPFKTVHGQ